jgi:predicted DNA-binding protein
MGFRVVTRDSVSGVPNQPKTPQHSFRPGENLWARAKAKAKRKGRSISGVLRELLEKWVDEDD